MMVMKTCNECKMEKPATPDYFHRNKSTKDGLIYTCKECAKKKKQKYYQENKEERLEYDRKYYQENKEERAEYYQKNKEEISEYNRKYYQENKEYYREYSKKHRQDNPEHHKEYNKKYRQENKEYYREYTITYNLENPEVNRFHSQRRRARVAQLPHTLTLEEWDETLEYFNNECAYCGDNESGLTQEHMIPVIKGGGYTADNIVPACQSCNSSKNSTDLEEWYVSYRHYDEDRLNKILDYVENMEEI